MDLLKGYNSCDSDNSKEDVEKKSQARHYVDNSKADCPLKKRRKLIGRPSRGKVKIVDNKSHNGQLFERTVPHVRGNWAGHVFICLEDSHISSSLKRKLRRKAHTSITNFQKQLESVGWSGQMLSHYPLETLSDCMSQTPTRSNEIYGTSDGTDEDEDDSDSDRVQDTRNTGTKKNGGRRGGLHVSLSRPFYLQLASIESFVKELKQRLSCESSTALQLTSKSCILVNEDKTRSFYGRKISPNPSILRLIHHIDQALSNYQQPTYYNPPILHTTLASVPGNIIDLMADDNDSLEDDDPMLVSVRRVLCTFGTTKEYSFDLKSP